MDEEIQFHLEARTEQLVKQGMSPERAREEAARRFGSLADARIRLQRSASHRERRLRLREIAGMMRQDVRIALRGLRRAPAFVALAVMCLALGVGANAAIYSVIDAVLLRPLPFTEPDRLVRVWPAAATPPGIYEIVQRESRAFAGIAGFSDGYKVSAAALDAPVRYVASEVTANVFDVLGIHPALGRAFAPGENAAERSHVVILSHGVWRNHYGGSLAAIGMNVQIDGIARTIVGVMPENFHFPSVDVQLWMPQAFVPSAASYWWGKPLRLIARLAPGVSVSRARAEAAVVIPRARGAYPMRMPDEWGRDVDVVPLRESVVGASRPTLLLLFAAVGLVLLIACVNVATLYVERALTREREIAVRTALGAGSSRIVVQLLIESTMIAVLGAAAGLAIAAVGVRVLVAMLPAGTPRAEEIAVDGHVLAFTLVLAVLSGLGLGMLPARRATRLDVQSALRRDGRSGDAPRQSYAVRALAIAQVALAVMVVTSAGLLLESFWRLHQVDLGFDTSHVIAAEIPLPSFSSDTTARAPLFYDAIVARARAIPGVRIAAATSALPFGAIAYPAAMEVEAHPTQPGSVPRLPIRTTITPDYFRALGIPLLRGRPFTDGDRTGSPLVTVIDASAAKTFWPNADAIGQRIRYVWNQDWFTVVGIVGDVTRDSLSGSAQPSLYLPMAQSFAQEMLVVVRASGDAEIATVSTSLRSAVAEVDPTVPVGDGHLLDGFIADSAARARFAATLLTLFAAVALLLGATGIYGIMTTAVSRRTREIGVRMALGATSGAVLGMILRESTAITIAGVALGIGGTLATGGLLRGMLFGVGAVDLPVLAVVATLLAGVALLATLAPARRASRVNPISAIRAD